MNADVKLTIIWPVDALSVILSDGVTQDSLSAKSEVQRKENSDFNVAIKFSHHNSGAFESNRIARSETDNRRRTERWIWTGSLICRLFARFLSWYRVWTLLEEMSFFDQLFNIKIGLGKKQKIWAPSTGWGVSLLILWWRASIVQCSMFLMFDVLNGLREGKGASFTRLSLICMKIIVSAPLHYLGFDTVWEEPPPAQL